MDPLTPNNLPDLDLSGLEAELRKEQEFGGKPLEAAAGSALSSATLGLSDAVLVEAGVDPERLREVRDRESEAATLGAVGGIVAPALLSAGTSLVAKGASAGIRGLTAAGTAAEKAALSALTKVAPTVGPKTALVAGQAARGAAEGALAGLGQEVSDIALDNKDLSAESVLASAGSGALLGAGFGTLFGAAQATVPTVREASKTLKSKISNVIKQGIAPIADPVEASLRLVTPSAAKRGAVRETLGGYAEDLPTYIRQDLELTPLTTTVDLSRKNAEVLETTGKQIEEIVSAIDTKIKQNGTSVTRAAAYQPLLDIVDSKLVKLGANPNTNRNEIKTLLRYREDIIKNGAKETPFSFIELDDLRKTYGGKKFKGGGALESFEANLANELRAKSREVLNTAADELKDAYPELSAGLKIANKKYTIGSTIQDSLEEAAERQPSLTAPMDFVSDVASRTMRNVAVIKDVAQRTANTTEALNKGLESFFKRIKPGKLPSGGISMLVNTGFAINPDTEKAPKNRTEAFANISKNVQELSTNPDTLVELLAKRTARIGAADPAVAAAMQQNLVSAVNFLNTKLPRPAIESGLFAKPYQPSSMELAKFERYVQVVEQPLTVFKELQQGTLTREHVEALKAVYPAIYQQIQLKSMEAIVKHPNLPYEKKVQLGILLDIPADSSLAGPTVLMLQASISGASQQEYESQGSDYREAGIDEVDMAGREATATQDIEAE